MNIKIAVNLNRIPDSYNIKDDFEKARLYHQKHGVNIEFIFKTTNIHGYTSYYNTTAKRWLIQGADLLLVKDVTADIDICVIDLAEWSTPLGSQFPLLPNTPSGSCQLINLKPFVYVGTYPTEHLNGQTWIQIAHEIVHALAELSNLHQYTLQDILDTYYKNSDPDAPDGNFAQMWALLKPFLDSQNPVILKRTSDDGIQTLGELTHNQFSCKTLERPWKNNLKDISCIPKGQYKVSWTFSPRLMKYTYEILNVLNRKGIRIHSGNYFFDVDGCIILGDSVKDINNDKKKDVLNSRVTLQKFEDIMQKKDFTLNIM